jgi:putative oxidoreductase
MNWFGNQKGEGFEYHLLAITIGLVIALRGSGALSLDRLLARTRASIPAEIRELAQPVRT